MGTDKSNPVPRIKRNFYKGQTTKIYRLSSNICL
nr:MAG TPA: hypothetical protein [Caudoviricetes sp.]